MKLLLAGLFAFTGAAFAANLAPASYHDGTLVSFPLQASESNCHPSAGQICSGDYQAQYLVKSEGVLYALTPAGTTSGSFAERVMLVLEQSFQQERFALSPTARNASPAARRWQASVREGGQPGVKIQCHRGTVASIATNRITFRQDHSINVSVTGHLRNQYWVRGRTRLPVITT